MNITSLIRVSRKFFNSSSSLYRQEQPIMNVFDRKTKGLQRERAANLENNLDFDYLKEEFGYRLADRVLDIKVWEFSFVFIPSLNCLFYTYFIYKKYLLLIFTIYSDTRKRYENLCGYWFGTRLCN